MRMETEIPIENIFTACSCSKTPHSADWNHNNGWIVFGSSRNVALISPETEQKAAIVSSTYCGHDGDVTCVKWIKNDQSDNSEFALSGATDSRVVLWKFDLGSGTLQHFVVCAGHSMTVTHVCGLQIPGEVLICSCSADSTMIIWQQKWNCGDNGAQLMQTINIDRSGFALCSDMRRLDNGVLLASGHDDKKIRLFWKGEMNEAFTQVMTLSGHEDWIRGLSFQDAGFDTKMKEPSLLFSTCSQDSYVRIWRLNPVANETIRDESSENATAGEIRLKRQMFSIEKSPGEIRNFSVGLETILAGHQDWVYSAHWHPSSTRLLTASMDKCLIVWEPDESSGLWIEKARLGVVGGPVASGFYGGVFGPNGKSILGHTFQGGFHIWNDHQDTWTPAISPSGHFGAVEDISWDVNGYYLLSCSADQTTRLFGPWRRNRKPVTVHEISRPQVHGYDMQCVTNVSSSCFVSGGEEKILRAFTSTKNFADSFIHITTAPEEKSDKLMAILCDTTATVADGAAVQSLGLSNKATFIGETTRAVGTIISVPDEDDVAPENETAAVFQSFELRVPPTENCLMQSTLWPEVHKLYGHGCEVFAIACNRAGTVIASAAKANKPEQAQVILWSTADWQQRRQIGGHSLTVTQIAFSPDDNYLLTVSRDRTWCLHRKQSDEFDWIKVGFTDKKTAVHTRIIWSCAWTSDSKYFVTASRDKKVVVWAVTNDNTGTSTGNVRQVGSVLETPDSATAVAMCPRQLSDNSYLIAVGMESGEILLYRWSPTKLTFHKLWEMNKNMAHSLTVKRLRFRPEVGHDWISPRVISRVYLASCSDDHSVKVFRISLDSF